MIRRQLIQEQLNRFAAVFGALETPARIELGKVMVRAQTEYQIESAVTALIEEPDRRWVPKPGELLEAILAAPIGGEARRPDPRCPDCHGIGWRVKKGVVQMANGLSEVEASERCGCVGGG